MWSWLPVGTYSAAGQMIAAGDHRAAGAAAVASAHTVLAASLVPPSLSSPLLWLTSIERWVVLAGLAVALGGLAGRGLARTYKGPRPGPLLTPWGIRGSLIGMAGSAMLLVTATADPSLAARLAQPHALGLPPSSTAVISVAELVLFALAVLLLRRQSNQSILPLFGVAVAESLRSHSEGMIPAAGAALTFCHLLPGVLWAGMLVYALRTAIAWRSDPKAMQEVVRQYGTAAGWLFALVVVTGVISAVLLVPVGSLLTTAYGRFLIVKAAIVGVAACMAIGGRIWLHRRPVPGMGPALATKLEVAALAGVLAVTGLLTVLTPPAKPIYPNATAVHARVIQPPTAPGAGHAART